MPLLTLCSLTLVFVTVEASFPQGAWCPRLENLGVSNSLITLARINICLLLLKVYAKLGGNMNITVDAPELEELDVGCTVGYAGSFTLRAPRLRCLKWRSLFAELVLINVDRPSALTSGQIRLRWWTPTEAHPPTLPPLISLASSQLPSTVSSFRRPRNEILYHHSWNKMGLRPNRSTNRNAHLLRCHHGRSCPCPAARSLPNQAPHVCYCSYAGSAPCYYPAPVSAAPSYTPSDHLLHSNVRIELLHTQELCRMGIISLWVLTYMKARYCSDQFCTSYDYDYDNTRYKLNGRWLCTTQVPPTPCKCCRSRQNYGRRGKAWDADTCTRTSASACHMVAVRSTGMPANILRSFSDALPGPPFSAGRCRSTMLDEKRDPPTEFMERLPVVVLGRRGFGILADALPSEGVEEHPGRDERRPTCAWGSPVSGLAPPVVELTR
ncbi:hypothetical protein HU200_015728 [Digitaria exilis]|uniref:Uncharacterized protein n=1 Tax=Digitaria exilis TaxID=1010633 RepID=A0A835F995_9POAL|nr:hypothetical protein HU200_015728 [Digitaria exilis]